MDRETARQQVEAMVRQHLERGRCALNPDAATVAYVRAGLADHLIAHGHLYCPCREVTGDPARDRRNICPCPQHRQDIARTGACECGIFVSHEYAAAETAAGPKQQQEET
jgi:ferredoxin-thioredoxin reductase catalytic subunit